MALTVNSLQAESTSWTSSHLVLHMDHFSCDYGKNAGNRQTWLRLLEFMAGEILPLFGCNSTPFLSLGHIPQEPQWVPNTIDSI